MPNRISDCRVGIIKSTHSKKEYFFCRLQKYLIYLNGRYEVVYRPISRFVIIACLLVFNNKNAEEKENKKGNEDRRFE